MPASSRRGAAVLAAATCAILLYLPALELGFVFDDTSLVAASGDPVALGGALPYRPLRYASYLVDAAFGGSPVVYHAHNIALHALVCVLTVLVALRLGARPLAAFAGAMLVALHPLSVESAAYVAGRRDLLCVAFGLGSLLAELRGRRAAALGLVMLSVAAKESGLVFLAPLAAAAFANGRWRGGVAAFGATSVAAIALVMAYGAVGPWLPSLSADGVAASGRVVLHYATGLLLLRGFAPEYPALSSDVASSAMLAASLVAALATAGGAVASAIACRRAGRGRGHREGAFALAWLSMTLAALAMWGSVHEPGADRHAYLLLPALGAGAALALSRKFVPVPVFFAALVAMAVVTRGQIGVWQDQRSLWSHAVSQPGASARAHVNFARIVAADGEYALARQHLGSALAAGGDDAAAYVSRAALRCAEGKRELAQRDVRRAHRSRADAAAITSVARECGLTMEARMHLRRRGGTTIEASGK